MTIQALNALDYVRSYEVVNDRFGWLRLRVYYVSEGGTEVIT